MSTRKATVLGVLFVLGFVPSVVSAQDRLPADNGLATYHAAPRYRESESHPLRVLAYVVHPVGWVAREVFFRPLSYFASSTEVTRSVMGFREPFDFRSPECFSGDSSVPDCRAISPYNYAELETAPAEQPAETSLQTEVERQVYFPDVNFDFDVRNLNDLGRGRVHQIAQLLQTIPNVHVVLEGNADYLGSEAYNEKLGMDRAEAVRQELVRLGIPAERLSTVTFGKSKPIFEEQQDWARAVNRRVEVHMDEGTAQPAEPAPAPVE